MRAPWGPSTGVKRKMETTILLIGLVLAYANGANDNFKGVATLFGSGTMSYRGALAWATATTLLGSLFSVALAHRLLERFTGKGIVSENLAAEPVFVAAVAVGAGLTVLLATWIGMPISTTHSLVGALAGAAIAAESQVLWPIMMTTFFLPLLVSPLLAILGAAALYPVLRWLRVSLGIGKETCLCVGSETVELVTDLTPALAAKRASQLTTTLGSPVTCQEKYTGYFLGVNCSRFLDGLHGLSAGLVSFARGLNDTPKIAALLLVSELNDLSALALCGAFIALGGIVSARRVARTMSQRITTMNAGQGFSANVVTGFLVVFASRWGVPVSTTHVSCGSLFGLGAVTRQAHWRMITTLLTAWVTTLPAAGLLSWLTFRTMHFL